jgi:hypothetical protein
MQLTVDTDAGFTLAFVCAEALPDIDTTSSDTANVRAQRYFILSPFGGTRSTTCYAEALSSRLAVVNAVAYSIGFDHLCGGDTLSQFGSWRMVRAIIDQLRPCVLDGRSARCRRWFLVATPLRYNVGAILAFACRSA